MSYLQFLKQPPRKNRKTDVWDVFGSDTKKLGEVSWYAHWRKYCYQPGFQAVYDEKCLREIADFLLKETGMHNESNRRTKKA